MEKQGYYTALGIGIFLVVLGHNGPGELSNVIYTFHMPLFFILGGSAMDTDRTWKDTILYLGTRFWAFILVTDLVYCLIALAVQATLGLPFQHADNLSFPNFFFRIFTENSHHISFTLTNWFLVAYALAYPLAFLTARCFGNSRMRLMIALILAGLSVYMGTTCFGPKNLVWSENKALLWSQNLISHILVGYGFMVIGFYMKKLNAFRHVAQSAYTPCIALVVFLWMGTALPHHGAPVMAQSLYPSGFLPFIVTALAGCCLVIWVSDAIQRTDKASFLILCGRHSKSIMIHHLFAQTLANLCLAALGTITLSDIGTGNPIFYRYKINWTWPLYAIVGVGLPLTWATLVAPYFLQKIRMSFHRHSTPIDV